MLDENLRRRIEELAEVEGALRVISLRHTKMLAEEFNLLQREVELAVLENNVFPSRYQRSFGTVGWEGQKALLNSTVVVVGAGGLGGYVLEGLSRTGIGKLVIVDGDTFADHNLNRQILSLEENLDYSKVDIAKALVRLVNSSVEVLIFNTWATAENLTQILSGANVVVDCLDRLPTRLLVQDAAQNLGIPMVHGAIAGYVAQVMTILPSDKGLRAFYSEKNVPQQGVEVQLGCPAATPMMAAAWQIQETVKIILKRGELLQNRMLFMDAEMGIMEILRIDSGRNS